VCFFSVSACMCVCVVFSAECTKLVWILEFFILQDFKLIYILLYYICTVLLRGSKSDNMNELRIQITHSHLSYNFANSAVLKKLN
jgi:hypothetical protein